MIKVGVLASGSGSNLQAILDAVAERRIDVRVTVVLSNVATAGALERAKRANVPAVVVDHKRFAKREDFDAELVRELVRHEVDWVVLAGFMRVVTPVLLDAFPQRVLNIHPSLLPAFPGQHAQRQAFEYGVRVSGCTVHLVDAGTDTGPVIGQRSVSVLDDDTEETLSERILQQEHALLPAILQTIAEGRLSVEPRPGARPRVRILPRPQSPR